MDVIRILVNSLEILLIGYFGFASIYVFVFSFAGLFSAKKRKEILQKQRKFAVLIPGYKEDSVIVDVAQQALKQTYPKDLFEVVIIADSFQLATLDKLKNLPLRVIEVFFEKSTKSKALNQAMKVIGDDYDVALILDADNIMEENFIEKINKAFNQGYKVVQGHRIAKNTNTSFAILDAISEEINNHIFRKGHRVVGLSSALIGSGMAFDYYFFKTTMANVNAVGGFDKELELKLLKNRTKIEYLNNALVLDEKVQKSEVFANQRKRWLSAQFVYFGRYFIPGLKELFAKGNVDFFDKVYQMVSPPRVLLLGLVSVITFTYVMLNLIWPSNFMVIPEIYWYASFSLVIFAFAFAVPKKFYSKATFNAILTLPKAFMLMLLSLFRLKGANKKFIHTQHGTINSQ
ncbi:glycosyltransferase [Flagellimonas pacifica]|uniref:Glycosyltransferase, catalytic subunit of cellulose synthase and poly-beta-1,6-N-acetylglucosamine synthase n=1 Tax=Flagellimonas pacifica TaxID=1247520 RepID=A0A285MVQ9_9FLAO|nr:glycosyltransferase [Allomuricauda parva]SNZ01279.1 Glycosyltransferase, catalytic subunit of cellulose synthase and poly-beta-1,6-N-acetylglucosamine synthase [Allomuricauda parva]